ncbi:MAG: hypothetical protein AUK44_03820 [Porphyromonadaceae bacterium CG2_30_38_12]|nr:MAG: hypothetical protein AUK44_03820 [Porphyromonadaceae bacterium CG2_30_38_12]
MQFENTKYRSHKLSIRIKPDGFSLYVLDNNQDLVASKSEQIALTSYSTNELIEIFRSKLEPDLLAHDVEVCYETEIYTLVPNGIFEESAFSDLLHFQHPNFNPADTKIVKNTLPALKAWLLYMMPNSIYEAIKLINAHAVLKHPMTVYLSEIPPINAVFVKNREGRMDVVVMQQELLMLANSYNQSTDEDFLYHILNTFETLQLDKNSLPVHIYGNEISESLLVLLRKYLRTVITT